MSGDVYQRAVDAFGYSSQMRMMQEECGELVAAVNQYERGRVFNRALASEVADVLIMARQARLIMGAELVDSIVEEKLERLEERIAQEEKSK